MIVSPADPACGPPVLSRAGAYLEVDLKALQHNYRMLAHEASPAACGASLKAEAYGVGASPAARALRAAGCNTFFVAFPDEGQKLRGILRDAAIYVLNGLLPGEAAFYAYNGLRPALSKPEEVAEWAAHCRHTGNSLPAAIHIETGINRLGITAAQVREVANQPAQLAAFEITLVMSHLAKADEANDPFNREQLQRFRELKALLPHAPASLANSPGIYLGSDFLFDLVRPGIALYGGNPFADRANPFRPVVRLMARILQIKTVAKGDSVGYGAGWRATRPSRIAVLGAGYGDGFPRAAGSNQSNSRASAYVAGHFAPIIGRISMDTITADVTDIPTGLIERTWKAELIGEHVTIDDLARRAGTISYEVLTHLGSRYPRLYSTFDSH